MDDSDHNHKLGEPIVKEDDIEDRYDLPGYDPDILKIADELKNKFYPVPSYGVGDIVGHKDGYKVRITAGMYWDGDGPERRLSNHWTWHPVNRDGIQDGPSASGYGNSLIDPKLN